MTDENTVLNALVDAYAEELEIEKSNFELMGKLLDKNCLKKRIEELNIKKIYIYGGGYLGIQFYRACNNLIEALAVVDKRGRLQLDIKDIPVIGIDKLQKIYKNEIIVVTLLKYYWDIKNELCSFIPENKIIFLGEFMEGIL